MDRKFVGILGAAVASAVAFLWFQSEDDDELEDEVGVDMLVFIYIPNKLFVF